MIIVTGEIRLAPGALEAARAAALTMVTATRAEAGCLTYGFYEDIGAPGTFRVYEEWTDMAALQAHFGTPHMAAFRGVLAGLEILGQEIKVIEGGTARPL
ncbi:MAG: putative quinol monooxygenase [Pseudomonadota bacterium]